MEKQHGFFSYFIIFCKIARPMTIILPLVGCKLDTTPVGRLISCYGGSWHKTLMGTYNWPKEEWNGTGKECKKRKNRRGRLFKKENDYCKFYYIQFYDRFTYISIPIQRTCTVYQPEGEKKRNDKCEQDGWYAMHYTLFFCTIHDVRICLFFVVAM